MTHDNNGVSRRRVLQGAVWTAPVVVIATAVPARAASEPGAIALNGVNANLTTGILTVNSRVAYIGDGGTPPDFPVEDVVVSILVPTVNVANSVPTVGSDLWQYLSTTTDGANTVFRFGYLGDPLTFASSLTPNLRVQIQRLGDFTSLSITVRADGTSDAVAVPQVSQTVTTSTGAELVFNVNPPIQAQTNYQGLGPAYVFYGAGRWNGPYFPVGESISDVTVTARVPEVDSTGVLIPGTVGTGWTLAAGPTLVEGFWRVVYSYSGTIDQTTANTAELQFGLVSSATPPTLNKAIVRIEGTTPSGSTVFQQVTGPTFVTAS